VILPSEINVVTEFPKAAAEDGTLNYYIPELLQLDPVDGDLKKVVDYKRLIHDWLVHTAEQGSISYAGMKSQYFSSQFVMNARHYTTEADRDRLYDLGYNPIINQPHCGIVIWGNYIAGVRDTLPDMVLTVEVLIDLDVALKKAYCYYHPYHDRNAFLDCTCAEIAQYLRDLESRRYLSRWMWMTKSTDYVSVDFITTPGTEWVGLTAGYDEGYNWYLGKTLSERMLSLIKLYPRLFVPKDDRSVMFGDRTLHLDGVSICLR